MGLKAFALAAYAALAGPVDDGKVAISTPSPSEIAQGFQSTSSQTYQTAEIGGWSEEFETKYPQDTLIKELDEGLKDILQTFLEMEDEWHQLEDENLFESEFYREYYNGFGDTMEDFAKQLKANDQKLLTDPSAVNERICIYQDVSNYISSYNYNFETYINENYEGNTSNTEFSDTIKEFFTALKEQNFKIVEENLNLIEKLKLNPSCAPKVAGAKPSTLTT